MRGRKHDILFFQCVIQEQIKKESPNEGTETRTAESCKLLRLRGIKKESPNEGTETYFAHLGFFGIHPDKKRIPE